jgi:hypothetical protein
MILLDGRATPTLRAFLGHALSRSTDAALAIRRIRLARLDLMPEELQSLRRCRVLLGRLDAETLAGSASGQASARTAAWLDMAASGRLEVRSSGLLAWDPDFSLIGNGDSDTKVLVFGSHQFIPQQSVEGLALACAITDAEVVARAAVHFEELWQRGYDALEAVTDALCRSLSLSDP